MCSPCPALPCQLQWAHSTPLDAYTCGALPFPSTIGCNPHAHPRSRWLAPNTICCSSVATAYKSDPTSTHRTPPASLQSIRSHLVPFGPATVLITPKLQDLILNILSSRFWRHLPSREYCVPLPHSFAVALLFLLSSMSYLALPRLQGDAFLTVLPHDCARGRAPQHHQGSRPAAKLWANPCHQAPGPSAF